MVFQNFLAWTVISKIAQKKKWVRGYHCGELWNIWLEQNLHWINCTGPIMLSVVLFFCFTCDMGSSKIYRLRWQTIMGKLKTRSSRLMKSMLYSNWFGQRYLERKGWQLCLCINYMDILLGFRLTGHENGAFRKRFSNCSNLKTLALRFCLKEKHFWKRWHCHNHVISLTEFFFKHKSKMTGDY